MSQSRLAVTTLACVLPMLVALGSFGRETAHFYDIDASGNVTYAGSETVETDGDGDVTSSWLCGPPGTGGLRACGFCGFCHTGGQDRQKEVFTSDKHLKDYYPRFRLSLSEAQKLSWGQTGGYLTSRRGKLEYYLKDGTLNAVTPPGSLILKDRSGRPFIVFMSGEPTLQPKRP